MVMISSIFQIILDEKCEGVYHIGRTELPPPLAPLFPS